MRTARLFLLICVVSVLAACGTEPSISSDTSARLTSAVVSVAESAADGKEVVALNRLDSIEEAVAKALADGDITEEKAESIQAAIDAVRADLERVVAAEKKAAEAKAAEEKAAAEKAAAEAAAAAEKAAADQAAADAAKQAEDDRKKAEEDVKGGPGKGDGKGKEKRKKK